ncbi:DUF4145 domain-containing protein [Streptomyces sp. NPDC014891]|uniref:DUF4145 domain-containing protein n=1 Tax=Streptomyces sp. NPDC014891 TaxID=3364929 RepID=UPI0036FD7E45
MPNLLIKDLRAIALGFSGGLHEWPSIPCPTCGRSGLTPVADTFVEEEAERSKRWQVEYSGEWEPDWFYGGFHCVLRCSKGGCDLVRVVGKAGMDHLLDDQGRWYGGWINLLTPSFFHPALPLVQRREGIPRSVQDRIDAASAVLWVDPSSAANRLRSAVEALMDDQGIPRRWSSDKGPYDVNLHRRIENFKAAKTAYSDAADAILAVKWIGNVGSHEDALKISDVLDGAEILDFALEEIYGTRDVVKKLAAEITARKGVPVGLIFSPVNSVDESIDLFEWP